MRDGDPDVSSAMGQFLLTSCVIGQIVTLWTRSISPPDMNAVFYGKVHISGVDVRPPVVVRLVESEPMIEGALWCSESECCYRYLGEPYCWRVP